MFLNIIFLKSQLFDDNNKNVNLLNYIYKLDNDKLKKVYNFFNIP
jgi:hypothetical protein